MQQVYKHIKRLTGSKVVGFLTESFFFALLYSTLLYVFVRLFFYDFPFTISEGFELHSKMLIVVWLFIITCKLVLVGFVLLENSIDEIKARRRMYVPVLRKSFLVMLAAALSYSAYSVKESEPKDDNTIPSDCTMNTSDEPVAELDVTY